MSAYHYNRDCYCAGCHAGGWGKHINPPPAPASVPEPPAWHRENDHCQFKRGAPCTCGQPAASVPEPPPWKLVFEPCGKCVTKTHCAFVKRCLAECVPADVASARRAALEEAVKAIKKLHIDVGGEDWHDGFNDGLTVAVKAVEVLPPAPASVPDQEQPISGSQNNEKREDVAAKSEAVPPAPPHADPVGPVQAHTDECRRYNEQFDVFYNYRCVCKPAPAPAARWTRDYIESVIARYGWWDGYEVTQMLRAYAATLPDAAVQE